MARRAFPPPHLLDLTASRVSRERFAKLEGIYHAGQRQAWDGRRVLSELLARHGGIAPLPQAQKDAIARVFTVVLWGELAAWMISAELADAIDDVEAKMAATSQAMDEARHFYVMRDYLLELGGTIPELDGLSRAVLVDLIETDDMLEKLVGMQLLVEVIALSLFRGVAENVDEPVLRDLMAYFHRDEARHVGLGVTYLPHMLARVRPLRAFRLGLVQGKILILLSSAIHFRKDDFIALGLDYRTAIQKGTKLQGDLFREITEHAAGAPLSTLSEAERRKAAPWIWVPRFTRNMNRWASEQMFPGNDRELPRWHRAVLSGCRGVARVAERALRATT